MARARALLAGNRDGDATARRPRLSNPRTWRRAWPIDRAGLAFGGVFVLGAVFYVWTAGTSAPFTFDNGGGDRYNLLATAFLHLRLSVGHAPAGLLGLAEPYNPALNARFVDVGVNDATNLHDDLLAGGNLYFLWGPAPALVLLVPLHLFGLEPSASVTVACFAVVGLGFALGTLRVVVAQVGGAPLWMCVLAAAAVALCSTVPFLLRTPAVTEDTIAGGYCFTMAGVWLVATALAAAGTTATGRAATERAATGTTAAGTATTERAATGTSAAADERLPAAAGRPPLWRPALASLCFGLAAGSRPPLALAAVALVPLYPALRATHSRRRLLAALAAPVGVCLVLLLAYNQARFGEPLEFGTRHQLAGIDPLHEPSASLTNAATGVWFYGIAPPRATAVFPFVVLGPQPLSFPPWTPPANYATEMTGGLLPMTPILVLLPALVWIWRRRSAWLGALGALLVSCAGAGLAVVLALSYENFAVTERYEVEFAVPLLLGALAVWLALSRRTRGAARRLVRVGGAALVAWGCATGFAISFFGYGDYLAVEHPGTYYALQRLGSPLSAVIANVVGHPVLAEVFSHEVKEYSPVSYTTLDTRGESSFWLGAAEHATVVIVSPDTRTSALELEWGTGAETPPGTGGIRVGGPTEQVTLVGPHQAPVTYSVPAGIRAVRLPVRLAPGVNQFELRPVSSTFTLPSAREPEAASVLLVGRLALEGGS